MMLTISGINFDQHAYDERADVLYLSVGEPQVPAETLPTPEGHAVDFDADSNVVDLGEGRLKLWLRPRVLDLDVVDRALPLNREIIWQ